jgi:hypothetical protein
MHSSFLRQMKMSGQLHFSAILPHLYSFRGEITGKYCRVTRDEMTGSSSDVWIYQHFGYTLSPNHT